MVSVFCLKYALCEIIDFDGYLFGKYILSFGCIELYFSTFSPRTRYVFFTIKIAFWPTVNRFKLIFKPIKPNYGDDNVYSV